MQEDQQSTQNQSNAPIAQYRNPVAMAAQQDAGYIQDTQDTLTQIQAQIDTLTDRRVDLNTDIIGRFETVSSVPSGVPRDLYDQVKIYSNGTTYRLYWFDDTTKTWHYATGT